MTPIADTHIDLTTPQRQSVLAIVFLGLRILRSLGFAQLAIIVLFVLQAPVNAALLVVPVLAILALGALSALAWWRYTFMLSGDELVVTKGVLRVDRLTVPLDRIQSMAIEQELLHRVTGLVKLSVDTAGSAEAEFTIDAVARPVAEELQRQAVTTRPSASVHESGTNPADSPASPGGSSIGDRVVFTHGPKRLLVAAITTWPLAGLIVLGPLLAFGDDFGEIIPESIPDIDTSAAKWWWVPVGILAFFTLSIMLNIVRLFLQDWDLTLRAGDTSLRRTSGLLSRTSKASSKARIQVITSTQNPLQHVAGIRSVNLATIGEGDLNLIGCDDEQWAEIVRLALPEPIADPGRPRRISPASVWLVTRNTSIFAAVVALIGWFIVGWWSLLAPLFVVPFWWAERTNVRNFRWRLGSEVRTDSNVISRETKLTLPRKTNAVTVTQTLFERRRGLGSVELVTGAGAISIGMLPIADARAVRDVVLHKTETDPRPWM